MLVFSLASRAHEAPTQHAPQPSTEPSVKQTALAPLQFLLGRWEAAGAGTPGASSGAFSFELAADGHAIVRHNESLTSRGRHADVMLVYREPQGPIRAVYADNEEHVIHYTVTSPSGKEAVFLSDESSGQPRFRLTYRLNDDRSLATKFEMAAPGSPEFKTYLEGIGHRK
jgi:hypothetical protein